MYDPEFFDPPVNVCIPVKVFTRIAEENTRADASTRVYVGLLVIAHEECSDMFVATLERIAEASLVTKRTVVRAIPILEKIGAITVARNAPESNVYSLVAPENMG